MIYGLRKSSTSRGDWSTIWDEVMLLWSLVVFYVCEICDFPDKNGWNARMCIFHDPLTIAKIVSFDERNRKTALFAYICKMPFVSRNILWKASLIDSALKRITIINIYVWDWLIPSILFISYEMLVVSHFNALVKLYLQSKSSTSNDDHIA